jgi:hypothetical protein
MVQAQDQAPGCATGAKFGSFLELVLPDQGGAVFVANLIGGVGGVTPSVNQGIWAVTADGKVHLVACKGDVIAVDDNGTTKTIGALSIFTPPTATGGQTRNFNRRGDLIYKVRFTDRTQGLYKVIFP